MDSFRERLGSGDLLIGTIVSMPSPEAGEILSQAGFDWLFVDMEHGALSHAACQHILQAAQSRVHCVVRAPSLDEVWIKRCLDIGASGIIVPHVMNAQDAQRAVHFAKYPPVGSRSVGIARAHKYGIAFEDYVGKANEQIAVILQIEHIEAVRQAESIMTVRGIDAVFVGPYDLSGSMKKIGQVSDPDVQEAVARVLTCGRNLGITCGIFAANGESAKRYRDEGFRLLAVGVDALLLATAARGLVDSLKT